MKQIIQDLKKGNTILEEVPVPKVKPGSVLIKTSHSLVSLGTERMLVEFGKANYFDKAKQQPDKVKMVLDKVKAEGLMPTLETVFNKLEQPLPLGYCNVGKVIEVGEDVTDFKIGDRVASNGQHAEFVSIPQNLVVHVPDNISDEEAAFTVIGAIGLQGIRLVNPNFGETVVVIGLGLIGLLTAEMLLANGCTVIGYDLDNGTTTATIVIEQFMNNPGATYAIEYAEGHLYTVTDGKVSQYKLDGKNITHVQTSGNILNSIEAQAITYDGSYLWITQNAQNVYKVNLDCTLEATITTGYPPNNTGWGWNGQNINAVNYQTGEI